MSQYKPTTTALGSSQKWRGRGHFEIDLVNYVSAAKIPKYVPPPPKSGGGGGFKTPPSVP